MSSIGSTGRSWLGIGAVLFLGMVISACGGGGGTGTQPPAPPPPPPPPPPPVNETLTNLVTDETFEAASVVLSFDVDGAGVTSNVMAEFAGISGTNTVAYDNAANAFTVSAAQGGVSYTQTFSPGDIDSLRSDNTLRVYTVDNGGGDVTDLVLLIPGDPVYGSPM